MIKTSYSRVRTRRRCKRQHWYRYVLKIQARRPNKPMMWGRIMHEMLEAHANKQDPLSVLDRYKKNLGKLFREEVEYYGNILDNCKTIFWEYLHHYEKRDDRFINYVRLNGKRAEHRGEVEIRKGIILVLVIDAVAETPDRRMWLVENKNPGKTPSEGSRYRDLQTCLYMPRLADMKLPEVDGVCWNYLKRKEPVKPEILKKTGRMSERAIDTLPSVYVKAVEEAGLDPMSYTRIIDSLIDRRESWFTRRFVPVNDQVIQTLEDEFINTVEEIANDPENNTRTIDRHCDWCEYEKICRAQLLGMDEDFVMEREYESRKSREERERDDD